MIGFEVLFIIVVGGFVLSVMIAKAIKSEPSKTRNWRGITQSSILQIPAVTIMLIVGFAVLITILFTGHVNEVEKSKAASLKEAVPSRE